MQRKRFDWKNLFQEYCCMIGKIGSLLPKIACILTTRRGTDHLFCMTLLHVVDGSRDGREESITRVLLVTN
jgi:hypothetical protein